MIYNEEMEASLLGACLLSSTGPAKARGHNIDAKSFFLPPNQVVWRAIDRLDEYADLVTVANLLREWGELENIGGEDYLCQLADLTPSPLSADYYAKEVARYAERRRVYDGAKTLMLMATEGDEDEIEDGINSLSARKPTGGYAFQIGEVSLDDDDYGMPTPWRGLNMAASTRGFAKGQLSIFRAYQKGGKTTAMIQCAVVGFNSGMRGIYATFADLDRKGIKRKMMRQLCGYGRPPDDRTLWDIAWETMNGWDAVIYDAALNDGGTTEELVTYAKAAHLKKPLDFIVIDYAQELTSSSVRGFSEYESAAVSARLLNNLARKLNIPVIIGSQITIGKDGGKTTTKGSRVWEEKAGWVLTISDDKDYIESTYSRFGGDKIQVPVVFNQDNLRFDEIL